MSKASRAHGAALDIRIKRYTIFGTWEFGFVFNLRGRAMRRIMLAIAAVALVFSSGLLDRAKAADFMRSSNEGTRFSNGRYSCELVEQCGPKGCGLRRICLPKCPDGFSCASLYGAYGPYGGTAYWGAYTESGWGYR
jgi:hypothetical protein